MSEMIRILDVVTPLQASTSLVFELTVEDGTEPWLGLVTVAGDYAAFVRFSQAMSRIDSAARLGGTWKSGPSVACAKRLPPEPASVLTLTLRFDHGVTRIQCGEGDELRFEMQEPLESVVRIDGVGRWRHVPATTSRAKASSILPPPTVNRRMQSNLIFDIGMHAGLDTAYYLKKGFRVVAVEANPILAQQGADRFASQIEEQQLTILNVGLAPTSGMLTFYVNRVRSEWSSFDKSIASRGDTVDAISVTAITPAELFASYGVPYFLKIDIEGYDRYVVQALQHLPDRPRYVSVENGELALLQLLIKAGYTEFKYVDQSKVPQAVLPRPPLEGIYGPHAFFPGSSGPFGEETPGAWHTAGDLTPPPATSPDAPEVWYDLHARLPATRSSASA